MERSDKLCGLHRKGLNRTDEVIFQLFGLSGTLAIVGFLLGLLAPGKWLDSVGMFLMARRTSFGFSSLVGCLINTVHLPTWSVLTVT